MKLMVVSDLELPKFSIFQERSFIWEKEVVDSRRKRKRILGIFLELFISFCINLNYYNIVFAL
jgi:hypothetical protein